MVMVNRIITAREEEELAKYVSGRLARTRSGYHLGRDLEDGQGQAGAGGHLRVPRRAMSARVPASRSPSVPLKRSASARRSVRGHQHLGLTTSEPPMTKSPSTYSHLSVKNGNVPPPSYEDATRCPKVRTATSVTSMVEVVTETVLDPKDNNIPAVIVTSTQRSSSKKGRRTSSEDRVDEHQS